MSRPDRFIKIPMIGNINFKLTFVNASNPEKSFIAEEETAKLPPTELIELSAVKSSNELLKIS